MLGNKLMMMWVKAAEKNERAAKDFSKNYTTDFGSFNRHVSEMADAIRSFSDDMTSRTEQRMKESRKRMLAFPTKTQLRILACLIDDCGHPLWEIAEELEVDEGYISRAIKELIELGVVYRGEERPSTRKITRSRKPPEKRPEYPLYIYKELEIIFKLHQHVKMKLAHLGANAPNTLMILSKWLETTKDACFNAGEGIRLDPKPFTDREIMALRIGSWPRRDFNKTLSEAMEEPQ